METNPMGRKTVPKIAKEEQDSVSIKTVYPCRAVDYMAPHVVINDNLLNILEEHRLETFTADFPKLDLIFTANMNMKQLLCNTHEIFNDFDYDRFFYNGATCSCNLFADKYKINGHINTTDMNVLNLPCTISRSHRSAFRKIADLTAKGLNYCPSGRWDIVEYFIEIKRVLIEYLNVLVTRSMITPVMEEILTAVWTQVSHDMWTRLPILWRTDNNYSVQTDIDIREAIKLIILHIYVNGLDKAANTPHAQCKMNTRTQASIRLNGPQFKQIISEDGRLTWSDEFALNKFISGIETCGLIYDPENFTVPTRPPLLYNTYKWSKKDYRWITDASFTFLTIPGVTFITMVSNELIKEAILKAGILKNKVRRFMNIDCKPFWITKNSRDTMVNDMALWGLKRPYEYA